jgi:hypothetical protein
MEKKELEKAIALLEEEIANLELTKTLDERLRERLESALEDLKTKQEG